MLLPEEGERVSKQILTLDDNRAWVACLSCYNEGYLNGRWMDGDALETWWNDRDDWFDAKEMADTKNDARPLCSRHLNEDYGDDGEANAWAWSGDEWAIHDYSGDISLLDLSEHPDMDDLPDLMRVLDVHPVAAAMLVKCRTGYTPTATQVESVAERMTCVEDAADWAYEDARDCYGRELDKLPHYITGRIDWKWIGEEQLQHHYTTVEYNGDIYALHDRDEVDC